MYFNSNMVRLRDTQPQFVTAAKQRFQFQHGTIERAAHTGARSWKRSYFNSNMVRLRDIAQRFWHPNTFTLFQFQHGTIERVTQSGSVGE